MMGIVLSGPGSGLYALLFVATAQAADDSTRFLSETAAGGIAEVQFANFARERAGRGDVKELARRIMRDHVQANEQVKALASQKGAPIPGETDAAHKREAARLAKLEGREFDRAYIDAMVKDHRRDIKEFEKQARGAKDAEIKAFAAQTLPTLRQHLEHARHIQRDLQAKK